MVLLTFTPPRHSRFLNRIAVCFGLLVLLFILSQSFELRRSSYSCRTLSSCLGFKSRSRYAYASPADADFDERETSLEDGSTLFSRVNRKARPEILLLVLIEDAGSWSHDFRETNRTAHDFFDLLVSTQLDLASVSLAVMTPSRDEYTKLQLAIESLPFARVQLFHHPEKKVPGLSYEVRHDPAAQLLRRAAIAKLRNYLMLRALHDEKHIIWLDGDVVELSGHVMQTMIHHSVSNGDVGIVTARCQQNEIDNYDKNAWRVNSVDLMNTVWDGDREGAARGLVHTRLLIPDLIKDTSDTDLVPLDSVGGTILYIRAELVRLGVSFPHFNVVGTTWSQFGWVAIETEGICYMARGLDGGGCFVLGGRHFVRHSDWG